MSQAFLLISCVTAFGTQLVRSVWWCRIGVPNAYSYAFVLLVLLLAMPNPRSNAAVVMVMQQIGDDVVLAGSGSANTTSLTLRSRSWAQSGFINPSYHSGVVRVGMFRGGGIVVDSYLGGISGGGPFGTGGPGPSTMSSGDQLGMSIAPSHFDPSLPPEITLPEGYVSGDFVSGTAKWVDETFDSLGVSPGVYVWSWGNGANYDTFTLRVVPEPSGISGLVAACGLWLCRRQRRNQS